MGGVREGCGECMGRVWIPANLLLGILAFCGTGKKLEKTTLCELDGELSENGGALEMHDAGLPVDNNNSISVLLHSGALVSLSVFIPGLLKGAASSAPAFARTARRGRLWKPRL